MCSNQVERNQSVIKSPVRQSQGFKKRFAETLDMLRRHKHTFKDIHGTGYEHDLLMLMTPSSVKNDLQGKMICPDGVFYMRV